MSPPDFGGHILQKGNSGLKRRFMTWADGTDTEYFAPALEEWTGTREYVVDRRNMRAYLYLDGSFVEL